jgi:hypothetical protein
MDQLSKCFQRIVDLFAPYRTAIDPHKVLEMVGRRKYLTRAKTDAVFKCFTL